MAATPAESAVTFGYNPHPFPTTPAIPVRRVAARYGTGVAVFLFAWVSIVLCLVGRQESQTFDEANHILAGYRYWMCADFAANSEHPPMVKLLATVPLLFQNVKVPIPLCGSSHSPHQDFLDGRAFLYSNDADSILFRTRLFAAVFTVALGVIVFVSARRMFGDGPAVIALAIFVFEPNILAHGFLVTTDMALACCLYAAVFAFYRYLEKPMTSRLIVTGVLAGTALAAKHSGILVFPILAALALAELMNASEPESKSKRFFGLLTALAFVGLIAYVTLWSFYGFRFQAQPGPHVRVSALQLTQAHGATALKDLFLGLGRFHLLPEAYLNGFQRVARLLRAGGDVFILGKMYPTGRWFYFPLVLLVKSTLGFLALLLLAAVTLIVAPITQRRALTSLVIPPLLFLVACLPAKLNLGIRHILPLYPFIIVLAAAGAWEFCKRWRGRCAVVLLLALHAISSLASFPNYIPYSNELFGGTAKTYKLLDESNVNWGQSLKSIQSYIRKNAVRNCWLAYATSADPTYYQIGCKYLPSPYSWISRDDMTGAEVEGTLLIGTSELVGPPESNPYAQFRADTPDDQINGTVLVFHGKFTLPLAFATALTNRASILRERGDVAAAVETARKAIAAAPNSFRSHAELARALAAGNHIDDARKEYQLAAALALSSNPEFNSWYVAEIMNEIRELQ